jgi:hypothetical protein
MNTATHWIRTGHRRSGAWARALIFKKGAFVVSEIIDMAAYRRNAQRALSDLHLQRAAVALEQARTILEPYWSAVPVGDVLCTIEDALTRLEDAPQSTNPRGTSEPQPPAGFDG